MTAYEHLLNQIDVFIRKYYKNRMIKGMILFVTFALLLYLSVITLEYFGRFSSNIRFSLFLFFILGSLSLLVYYVLIPLSKILSFGKLISREQASLIIGDFFPDISDKLYNTLELGNETSENHPNFELIRASVGQRAKQLSVFNFPAVIDLRSNIKYAKYFAIPLFLLGILLIFNPSFIKEPTERVIAYNKEFEKPKDFEFYLLNSDFTLNEGEDLLIEVEVKGRILPENVFINSPLGNYQLQKLTKNKFTYTFNKVAKSFKFQFAANNEVSSIYEVEVIPNAVIGKFNAKVTYPSYIGREVKNFENVADLSIPEGSIIEWDVFSKNTKEIKMLFSDTNFVSSKAGFTFKKRFLNTSPLTITLQNKQSNSIDSLKYFIQVVKDQYPVISVEEKLDTVSSSIRFFEGKIGDDYGLTALNFHYEIKSKDGQLKKRQKTVLKPSGTAFSFNFAHDFRNDTLQPEDKVDYYFIVYDNDGVNGSKATKSQSFTYSLPSKDELIEKRNETIDNAKDNIKEIMKEVQQFNRNLDNFKKDNLNAKTNSWEQQNKLQQLQEQQQSLQNQLEQLQEDLNESFDEKNSLLDMDPELQEKYDLLQELLEQVMDQEMMDLLKELQDLLKENNKPQFNQKLEEFDLKSKDLNKQLDRSLELLKKTQVNELMNDLEETLQDLAKEQDELREQLENREISKEEALKKQKELEEKFNKLKEEFEKLNKLNEELQRPYDIEQFNDLKDEITDELQDASESLDKNKTKKATGHQKSAADKMKELADAMDAMQNSANAQQNEEDMQLIRQILKNLIASSFAQEDIINQVTTVNFNDPYFNFLSREQRKLMDKSMPIIDSLTELAKRQPQIASFIDKEVSSLRNAQKNALFYFGERNKFYINSNTQLSMTSYNNLALLLNESLQQLQMDMQGDGDGDEGDGDDPASGQGGKSGKGKQGKDGEGDGGDFKQQLKDQLDKLKNGMNPGGQQPGNKPGENGLPSSELVKMIMQQRMLRQHLEKMRQELNKDGKGFGNQLNPLINDLEQQEKDLLNKNIGREQIRRQQDILTRLLESEKAIRERGFEEKRESKSAKNYNLGNQNRIDEYNKQKLHQLELFRTIDPEYSKYYLDKATEYFNKQL